MCAVIVSMVSYNFNSFDKNFDGCICTGYGRVFVAMTMVSMPWTAEEICPMSMRHFGACWLVFYIPGGMRCGRLLLYILENMCGWFVALVSLDMEFQSMDRGNISAIVVPELH